MPGSGSKPAGSYTVPVMVVASPPSCAHVITVNPPPTPPAPVAPAPRVPTPEHATPMHGAARTGTTIAATASRLVRPR